MDVVRIVAGQTFRLGLFQDADGARYRGEAGASRSGGANSAGRIFLVPILETQEPFCRLRISFGRPIRMQKQRIILFDSCLS